MDGTAKIVIILGPTASGKSELALRLARECGGELVNADSLQVYRRLDIGTAKPTPAERDAVRHHLVDILEPHEPFTVADFVQRADAAIADITSRGRRPIVVGGTGLYIKALTKGLIDSPGEDTALRQELQEVSQKEGGAGLLSRLMSVDPVTASRLHSNDIFRIIRALEVYYLTGQPLSAHHLDHRFAQQRYRCLKFAIAVDREELYRRINVRVEDMLQRGLEEEVSGLLAAGVDPEQKSMKSIGYKEMVSHLTGMMTLTEAADTMARQTRRYGKRQMTWFRTDSEIKWVEYPKDFDTISKSVIDFFE